MNQRKKINIKYNYNHLSRGSIIGSTVTTSDVHPDYVNRDGLALTVLTEYDQQKAFYIDLDEMKDHDQDLEITKRIDQKHQSEHYRFWNDIYLIIPWYKYYQNSYKLQWDNKGNIIFSDKPIYSNKPLLPLSDKEIVMSLWKSPQNTFSTVYYPANILKFPSKSGPDLISVQFLDEQKTQQTLPIHAEIKGFKIPTVIRRQSAKFTVQLNNCMVLKYGKKGAHPSFSHSQCLFEKCLEYICNPCGHYINICGCDYCHDLEKNMHLNTKCKISKCEQIVNNLTLNSKQWFEDFFSDHGSK